MRNRKFAITAAALAVAVATAAVAAVAFASAPTTSVLITVTAVPNEAGTRANPRNIGLSVAVGTRNSDGSAPPVVANALVSFDRNLVFAPAAWPSCTVTQIQRTESACVRKGAKVGTGRAVGKLPAGPGAPPTIVNLTVTAFDGPGSNQFNLLVVSRAPAIRSVLPGRLINGRGQYGKVLDVAVPQNLQSPAPNVYASLTDFSTNISRATRRIGGKRISYVRLAGCSTGRRLNYKYEVVFRRSGGPTPPSQRLSAAKSYPCRP